MSDKPVPFFEVSKPMMEQISQAMLECKKMGRSLENSADSLIPLTDHTVIKECLEAISKHGQESARLATEIYRFIAREAAKP